MSDNADMLDQQVAPDRPELIASEHIYQGRVFSVRKDVLVERGVTYQREVVDHAGSAVILPMFEDGTIALVKQYRHPARKYLWEIPAGSLDAPEAPETGARRELEEELGYVAGRWEKLAEFYISPGFLAEKMHLFLATDLKHVGQKLEADELIETTRLSLARALEMIATGELEDAKTLIALLLAARRFPAAASD